VIVKKSYEDQEGAELDAPKKAEKKSTERFPVEKDSLTVFRTEEEFAAMEPQGWKRV